MPAEGATCPAKTAPNVIGGMALFSYKVANGVLQLILESGAAPMNLLGLQDPESGIDFRPASMLAALRTVCGVQQSAFDDKGEWSAMRGRPDDLAEGRLFMQKLKDRNTPPPVERLRAILDKMGHTLEDEPRKGTFHLMEGEGGPYLAVPGAYTLLARALAKDHLNYYPESFLYKPDNAKEPFHRLVLKEGDAVILAREIEDQKGPATGPQGERRPLYHVINHTTRPVLQCQPEAVITRPYLVTAKLGAEIHPLRGNVCQITEQLPAEVIAPGASGSILLRGKSDDQRNALKSVKQVIPSLDLRTARLLSDVPEEHPEVVVASKAADILNARLESSVTVSQASLDRVDAYRLKESALERQQAMGVAFILDNDRTLNADATGGGKTIMTALGLHLKTPPGEKILVTCPPGIITQWVRCIDKFLPDLSGPDAKEANQTPAWFKRLPVSEQQKLDESWARVRQRFVFVPESALESGVEMGWGKRLKADPEDAEAQNALKELNSIMEEPIGSILVDEAHVHRNAGHKFGLLEDLVNRVAHERGHPIGVVLATATPLHRDAPDLFPLLRLLGLNKFRKMEPKDFCEEYCYRKVAASADGKRHYIAPVPPHGFGMLREEKIPEIARILSERMLSREKQELAPTRIRERMVTSPLPYTPSENLGVMLNGFRQEGTLVKLPDPVAEKLTQESSYIARSMLLAHAKVPQTLADVKAFLADPDNDGQKITVYSQYNLVAASLSAELTAAGVANHRLTGGMDGRGGRGTINYMRPNGRSLATKQQLVDDFIADKGSRVLISTIGAGGTGIDGLHTVARDALFNDFTMVGGAQEQAEGRHTRVESKDVELGARPVHIRYQVAEHPMDINAYNIQIKRRHEMAFIRMNGLLQGLDSPEARVRCEMLADAFRVQVEKQVGLETTVPLRDNTYLMGGPVAVNENYQLDLSPLPAVAEPKTGDESDLSIRAIAPPEVPDDAPKPPRSGPMPGLGG